MKKILAILTLCLLVGSIYAQEVTVDNVFPKEVKIQAFTMSGDGALQINGTAGVFDEDWKLLMYYGWIIDADSREVVWHLFDFMKKQSSRDIDGLFDFKTKINLKKGNYELYYAGMYGNSNWDKSGDSNWNFNDLEEALDWVFGGKFHSNYRNSDLGKLFITAGNKNLKASNIEQGRSAMLKESVVSLAPIGHSKRVSQGITLTKETKLRIYALGEGDSDEMFDFAWITNLDSGERVFELNRGNSRNAGGAKKNFMVDQFVTLAAGSYMVNYSSDGSHSYDKWNALPPNDLQFWGITIWPATAKDRSNFIEFKAPKTMKPIVSLVKARDDEMLAKGISVKKDMQVRILCIGEDGNGDRMADFGWIVDASSKEKVWTMKPHRAKHAGGANKNRYVEETITLEKGDYIVYYTTDDSHAYGDWNSSQPFEPEMWGITIWATQEGDLNSVVPFHPKEFKNENELAVIGMVGNRALINRTFSIDKDTKVRIVGIGEGSNGEMHDFGFVKNMDTGKIVWEMDYRNSTHGGGARKNREFNESMVLEKGTYRVYFESDGSHSYRQWNDSPPTNQELWGISVLKD